MPVYHSNLNGSVVSVVCGSGVLPLKSRVKGPAPAISNPSETDIVDEAILYFRANVLFRNYAPKGPADLTLAYLTVWIGELLRAIAKTKSKDEAKRQLTAITMSTSFAIPGEKSFCLPGFFPAPANKSESDLFRQYYRQIREETANRLVEVCFLPDNPAQQNKWWICFAKRKFMNIAST